MSKVNFEKSLLRLEEITQKLESGELSLDESLKIFEEGIKLARVCENKLTEAEQTLEILKSTDYQDFEEEKAKAPEIESPTAEIASFDVDEPDFVKDTPVKKEKPKKIKTKKAVVDEDDAFLF